MSIVEPPSVDQVRRLRHRQVVDRLDELRLVRQLSATMSQTALAKALAISQPAVNNALKRAAQVPDVPAGFSGASPYEIAERYAAGMIDRDQLIDELGRFPYAPTPTTDGYDWLTDEVPNTVGEVGDALDDGLIDEDTYVAIQHRIDEYRRTASS
jgi:DNA-binding CsgD family transcriptional regulator